ncbi:hypothetical protein JCM10212_005580 [Sporobolomyces blumeae]
MASFNVESLRPEITRFLQSADKSAVSAKAVRKALEAKYPGLDVKSHKKEIDELTISIFTTEINPPQEPDIVVSAPPLDQKPVLPSFHKVEHEPVSTSSSTSSSLAPPSSSPAFPIAKVRTTKTTTTPAVFETDEEMARRLQEELNGSGGGGSTRSTRNGGSSSATLKSKKQKRKASASRKSKATISDDDDDDLDGDEGGGSMKKKTKRKVSQTGFNKPHLLSPAMAAVCGKQVLSRPGVTKALWVYIKANGLQDPAKKTEIIPDELLKRVLPFERINSFTMAKHISPS